MGPDASCANELGDVELSWFDMLDYFDQARICKLSKRDGIPFAQAVREIFHESVMNSPQITTPPPQKAGRVLLFSRKRPLVVVQGDGREAQA